MSDLPCCIYIRRWDAVPWPLVNVSIISLSTRENEGGQWLQNDFECSTCRMIVRNAIHYKQYVFKHEKTWNSHSVLESFIRFLECSCVLIWFIFYYSARFPSSIFEKYMSLACRHAVIVIVYINLLYMSYSFSRSCDTILNESGVQNELFLVDRCDDINLACVLGKCDVSLQMKLVKYIL